MRASHTWHAETQGLGPMQNNLHLSFYFFDSARPGVHWLVFVIVRLVIIVFAQPKSLFFPKNFFWPNYPKKKSGIDFFPNSRPVAKIQFEFTKRDVNRRGGESPFGEFL